MPQVVCPITKLVPVEPVIDPEGNTFERSAIEKWIREHGTSPLTRSPLALSDLVPNRALIEAQAEEPHARPEDSPPPALMELPKVELSLTTRPSGPKRTDVLVSIKCNDANESVPTDFVCVLDVSGSMGAEATLKNSSGATESHGLSLLDVVKHATKTIVASLSARDRLSVVAFDSTARVVFDLISMTEEGKKKANIAIDALAPGSMTNLWDGLAKGLDQIHASPSRSNQAAVLVLTDGLPNIEPPRGHLPMLRKYRDKQSLACTTIHTFGFGYSLDSALLLDIANEGNGFYGFIPDSSFVGTVFVHAISNIRSQATRVATLKLEAAEGLEMTVLAGGQGEAFPHTKATWGVDLSLGPIQYGQSRDVVVRLKGDEHGDSTSALAVLPCVEATLLFKPSFGPGKTDEVVKKSGWTSAALAAVGNNNNNFEGPSSSEVVIQSARLHFVEAVAKAVNMASTNEFTAAQAEILSLQRSIAKARDSSAAGRDDPRLSALEEDVVGQVTEAVSRDDYFNKWGKHYLRSLANTHALQRASNFKDPGVQLYGGALFAKLRDAADDIFMTLPPPKPSSRSRARSSHCVRMTNMSAYNNRSTPCFAGSALVHMATEGEGSGERRKPCSKVKKGDKLEGGGEVLCVVKTYCKNGEQELVKVGREGLLVTPWHPVRLSSTDAWEFPAILADSTDIQVRPCEAVYSFLLTRGPHQGSLLINGVECIALAHGLKDEPASSVASHPFWGTDSVADALKNLKGWDQGLVELRSGAVLRNPATGLVEAIEQN